MCEIIAVCTTLSSCSMYSSNDTDAPFDANNQHCKQLWRAIHTSESRNIPKGNTTNTVGQIKDLSQVDLEQNQKLMQYERDCELPAHFNERKKKEEKIKVE